MAEILLAAVEEVFDEVIEVRREIDQRGWSWLSLAMEPNP